MALNCLGYTSYSHTSAAVPWVASLQQHRMRSISSALGVEALVSLSMINDNNNNMQLSACIALFVIAQAISILYSQALEIFFEVNDHVVQLCV